MQPEKIGPHLGDDLVWKIGQKIPGLKRKHEVRWDAEIGDGSNMADAENAQLRSEFQAYVRSAVDRPNGIRMDQNSIAPIVRKLYVLAYYMKTHGIRSIGDLDGFAIRGYVSKLEEMYEKSGAHIGRSRKWGYPSAYLLLLPIRQMWDQRAVMAEIGVATLPEEPFEGRTPFAVVVDELGFSRPELIPPLEDAVATPVLSAAFYWIEKISPLVIALKDEYESSQSENDREAAEILTEIAIEKFEKSLTPRTLKALAQVQRKDDVDALEGRVYPSVYIRALVNHVIAACTICIQACTGIRAHEVLSLKGRRKLSKGLPSCVKMRPSSDGLMEIFYLKGLSAKRSLIDAEWVIGCRPKETSYLPPPVAAVKVLEELLLSWRILSCTDNLLITCSYPRGVPRWQKDVGPIKSDRMTIIQKRFVRYALVAEERSTDQIEEAVSTYRAHRWRPTFAVFVFRTDASMLIPLRDHFKHISEMVTSESYVGADAKFLEDLDGERVKSTAQLLLAMSQGKRLGAGSAQHLIDQYHKDLAEEISGADGEDDYERAVAWVKGSDIRIWNGLYATCLMGLMPANSKCNDLNTLPLTARSAPNFVTRSPGVCASCKCCLILAEHRPFWAARAEENRAIVRQERTMDRRDQVSIAALRVRQSEAILKAIDRAITSPFVDDLDES
ncbi:hypothetical protein [Xanthomonas sp. SHU 166]|uniref:hypothetical protein n=1 Tax=Xanthomonas sp. SHU 166 TaxID=1591170 RepID=UPI00039AABE9|nr:hypothetical protein [Xanthomonas sp. SHU 166]